ncbi:ABC transporter substrate-binding protein [Paracoccus sp. PAR01]|nr:ABC transporter substrate-binding protein [Paracoccus sp. PAR01]
MVTRRTVLGLGTALVAAPRFVWAGGIQATDVLGNAISLPKAPERIILLDATDLLTMAALLPDPGARVVGMASAARLDLGLLTPKFVGQIPEVGQLSPDTVSVEGIIGLKPDLVVASAYMLPPEGSLLVQHLQAAGIPVAWTSGHDGALPAAEQLTRAMGFWGAVLQRQDRAAELTRFGLSRLDAVRACAQGADRPRVYMEIMSTFDDCCWSAGRAFWGDLIGMAGGDLIASSDGWSAKLSTEGLLAQQPQVYVATGAGFAPDMQPGIGPGLDPAKGREGLRRAAMCPAIAGSAALRDGRVHGIWSGLITSPLLVPVLAECLGKWLQPGSCAALDPEKTLAALNAYLVHPLPGPLWLSLGDD